MPCGVVTMAEAGAAGSLLAAVVVVVVVSVVVVASVFSSFPPQELKQTRMAAQHGSRTNRRDFMVVDLKIK
jgi:hypothetical protein